MSVLICLAAIVVAVLVLAYLRAPLWLSSLVALAGTGFGVYGRGAHIGWLVGVAVVLAILNFKPLRRALITGPLFGIFKKITPPMSQTEQEAVDAGTVWWDRDLFSGKPDFAKLHSYPAPKLSAEEEAFLNGPTEQLCAMLDDWKITTETKDLPPEVWQFIKDQGFLGMIIKREYGGKEFSNYAHARVVTKIATRSGSAAVTVMVPNSLGPGELLQHYGTEAQKNYYLPRLAKGVDIPCFALTSPEAGSDAGGIPDFGVVARGSYTDPLTGEHHDNVLGIRLSWEKRYITLGPVATVLGMAFKLYDPEHLIGEKDDIGITCALIPTNHEGVNIGRRHYPGTAVFMNGPNWGKDVFIPMDWVIGGASYVGQGWRMLVECLSVGRCISLPAMSVASGKVASFTTGAYARIRNQFGLAIGRFEGVDEALGRIGGMAYQMDAAQRLALTGLDMGEKPSVLSGILKYHNTERMRKVLNDAMDVHAGKAVCIGPRNYLASGYGAIPVAITVEGANILTRSMIIYGQGAIRCHPFVLKEMRAAMANDAVAFDDAVIGHMGFTISNKARAFVMGLTGARLVAAPKSGPTAQNYRDIVRLSAAFAFLSDMGMATLGGSLKFREKLSARLGDMLSGLYIATAALKKFHDDGEPKEDRPLVRWAVESALYDVQEAMNGFLNNHPNRFLAWCMRRVVFPLGMSLKGPADRVGTRIARSLMEPSPSRARLTEFMYVPKDENDAVGVLEPAMKAVIETEGLESKLRRAQREGQLRAITARGRLEEARAKGFITEAEFAAVERARRLKREVIMVDDFDKDLKHADPEAVHRVVF
ncbi:acyl-CoA dehydrogenase [Andreprevotia lacus DSM 23236]|jgi:acyl-CoA dehydrogenase|uniref:Acyl-coenzyme A dehydrogenase n=1 Tax=Andreprevotia lacus DSM 23236 TaxID=1121001 RepID=A0A1W1XZG1_9NEIS|nr:acyl-CoA dehydrogenase [Andreprevotia lacus]SMC29264.1 acyl-CoA dehydrogenase [Andreprevotia lacus DSM 23236]